MKNFIINCKNYLLGLSLIVLLSFNSCDTPTGFIVDAIPDDNATPGRRDYSWTIDTLDAPDNSYYSLWGSSPSNIYTVSPSNWEKSFFHFNGEKWSSFEIWGLFGMSSIFGFSSDKIFVTADAGAIWDFDGNDWSFFAKPQKEGLNYFNFQNIWGESPNDFYAFGAGPDEELFANKSVIAHFQNNTWTMLNTDDIIGNVGNLYKNKRDGIIYLNTYRFSNDFDSTLIYQYSNGRFKQLYSSEWIKGKQAGISLINGEVYFFLGSRIAIRVNYQFHTILNVTNPNFYRSIWGRNSKDLFLLMTDGLAHFNGTDLQYLFYFNVTPKTQIFGAALFENDVFFLVYEFLTRQKLVYHGRLN